MTSSRDCKPKQAEQGECAETASKKRGQADTHTAPPAWVQDLESQCQGLFDALLTMIEDDKAWCDAFISQSQSNPDKLMKRCVRSRKDAAWTLHPPKQKFYKEYLNVHKEACLQHIAFLKLVVQDLHAHQVFSVTRSLPNAPKLVLLPLNQTDVGLTWAIRAFAQASEHLVAVRMLVNKDSYLSARRKGGQSKAQAFEEKDLYELLRPLVKILLQSESHRKHSVADSELVERYVLSIIEIWKCWPFFSFDKNLLRQAVSSILVELNVTSERKRSLFERRRRTPISRPEQFSRSTELEANQCEAWQGGLITALTHILKTSFGHIDEENEKKITQASPEQLCIWLCRTHKANSVAEVLS